MGINYLYNERLQRFKYPLMPDKNIPAQALRAIMRASIDLLRDTQDPEAIFLGALLTDIRKLTNPDITGFRFYMDGGQLVIEANPFWVVYLENLSMEALKRALKHELMHLVLHHPENLKLHTDTKDRALALLAMDIGINNYLSTKARAADSIAFCPECLAKHVKEIKPGENYSSVKTDKDCCVCHGTGNLHTTYNRVNAILKKHGVNIRPPLGENIGNYRPLLTVLREKVPEAAISELCALTQPLIDYASTYEEMVVTSMANHALAQTDAYNKNGDSSGSLLSICKEMRKAKKVPYILQVRGVLGASMKDEGEPTRYRPNRRFGYEYPGTKSVPKQRYVFAVDTSGSVPLDEIKKIINEFLSISDYSDKVECRIIFFHHSVYYDKEVKDYTEKDLENLQSGGTNFDKVLEQVFLDEEKREKDPAVLMLYTDGYCSIGFDRRKVRGNVYWLLMPDGTTRDIKHWDKDAEIIRVDGGKK